MIKYKGHIFSEYIGGMKSHLTHSGVCDCTVEMYEALLWSDIFKDIDAIQDLYNISPRCEYAGMDIEEFACKILDGVERVTYPIVDDSWCDE